MVDMVAVIVFATSALGFLLLSFFLLDTSYFSIVLVYSFSLTKFTRLFFF